MTQNMGTADRLIRGSLAVVIAALYLTGRIGGTLALVLGIFAVAFALTSIVGWCPVYQPLGLSTCKRTSGSSPAA